MKAWSSKREPQLEHVKESLGDQGRDTETAERIAARTVTKRLARAGESEEAGATSTDDLSSGRCGDGR